MSKIRESARGEQCTVRVPGICDGDPETVVLAHLNGGGMGIKQRDIYAAYCCSKCHAWIDGEYALSFDRYTRDLYHLQAVIETQERLIEKGLMSYAGDEIKRNKVAGAPKSGGNS